MRTFSRQCYFTPLHTFSAEENMVSLTESVKKKFMERFSETSILQSFSEAKMRDDVVCVAYDRLAETEIAGFPIGSDRNRAGKLEFAFSTEKPNTHIINIGTTGSGKTTGFVEPGLRAISSKKNKPNIFITDPKGELFERNAMHLKKQGYRLYLLNFKDVLHSDCWNPLLELFDTYVAQKGLKNQIAYIDDCEKLRDYHINGQIKAISNGFWIYGKNAYSTEQKAIQAYENEIAHILSETSDLVHQLVHTLIPDSLQAKNDPSWFMGAQEILSGFIYAMLEDALDDRSGFSRDYMNLMNIRDYFDAVRTDVVERGQMLLKAKKMSHKSNRYTSVSQMRSYFDNAASTKKSYLGCFRNAMQSWFNSKIFTICNGNTINLEPDDYQPFVIFLITRDFEKSDFTIAGMFIDWVYRKMLERADKNRGKQQNETYFILDEFANIPPIKDFENKITTSRSRNIWFHLYLQSYAQLEMVYGACAAQTIMDNCNTHVFMGSQNYDTKSRFIRECGNRLVPSMDSLTNPQNKRMIEVPLLNIQKLDTIMPGEMYMRRSNMPLTLTKFIRSYQCPEFSENHFVSPEELGIESSPFNAEKYRYKFLENDMTMDDYANTNKCSSYDFPDFLFEVI